MPVTEIGSVATPIRENQLLALIPRWKWAFFTTIALLLVLAFPGGIVGAIVGMAERRRAAA